MGSGTSYYRAFYLCKPKQSNFPSIVIQLNDSICRVDFKDSKPSDPQGGGGKIRRYGTTIEACVLDSGKDLFLTRGSLNDYMRNYLDFNRDLSVYVVYTNIRAQPPTPDGKGIWYTCDLSSVLAE